MLLRLRRRIDSLRLRIAALCLWITALRLRVAALRLGVTAFCLRVTTFELRICPLLWRVAALRLRIHPLHRRCNTLWRFTLRVFVAADLAFIARLCFRRARRLRTLGRLSMLSWHDAHGPTAFGTDDTGTAECSRPVSGGYCRMALVLTRAQRGRGPRSLYMRALL